MDIGAPTRPEFSNRLRLLAFLALRLLLFDGTKERAQDLRVTGRAAPFLFVEAPMRTVTWMAGLFLLMAGAAQAEDRPLSSTPFSGQTPPARNWIMVEPPTTRLVVGDQAPEFSYLGVDGMWHRAADLLGQGRVVLIIGADEAELRAQDGARDAFLDLGIVPAFLLDMRPGSVASLQRRLGLKSALVSDPQRAIAELYNSVDPVTARHAPAFFVVDGAHTIRALCHGAILPPDRLLALSARSLGLPVPQAARPTNGF